MSNPNTRFGFVFVSVIAVLLTGAALRAEKTPVRVQIRLIDGKTGQVTPAMVCITDVAESEVRLPPDGRVSDTVSRIDEFYKGVDYQPDHNWIGPIRKTTGEDKSNRTRSYVYGVRPSLPYWQQPVMYQTSGQFDIDLPPGTWQIAVEHGMEYIPIVEKFDIRDGDQTTEKKIVLNRWVDLSEMGWWSGDVHVHHPILNDTHREFLLHYATAEDLNIVNILEMGHHKGTNFKQMGFGPKFRVRRGDYCLVAGQEDPRSTYGHIIGLNLKEMVRDLKTYDFYDVTFEGIQQQENALVGYAHFAWNGCQLPRGFPWYITTGQVDFVELMQFNTINTRDYYNYLNLGLRLIAAAGSDVPWGTTIGEVRTYVYTGAELNIDDWFASLKKGHSFVSNGPALLFTVDDQLPGSELERKAGDTVKIQARAWGHPKVGLPKSLTIVGNTGELKQVQNTGGDGELVVEFEHPVDQSQWLAARTICDNDAVAHTTPVYIVVDGRGTFSTERGPQLIRKELQSIAKIEKEVQGKDDPRSRGVMERLQSARQFYADLEKKMTR